MPIPGNVHGMKFHRPGVISKQAVGKQAFFKTGKVLDRFGRLERTERTRHRAQDARLLAIEDFLLRRRRFEKAAVTGAAPRQNRHCLALQTDDASVRKGNAQLDGDVIDDKLGREIVAAVDDKIVTRGECRGIVARESGFVGDDLDVGIEGLKFFLRGLNFAATEVRGRMQYLALEI